MRLPLATTIQSRDGTLDKDSKLVNAFVETAGESSSVFRRPGTTAAFDVGTNQGRGLFCWKNTFFAVAGNSLIQGPTTGLVPDGAAWTDVADLSNIPGPLPNQMWYEQSSDTLYFVAQNVTKKQVGTAGWATTVSTGLPAYTTNFVALLGNKLLSMGGYNGITAQTAVYVSTDDGATFSSATLTPGWARRSNATCYVVGSTLYMYGGIDNTNLVNTYYGDLWKTTDGTNWTQVVSHGLPTSTGNTHVAKVGTTIVMVVDSAAYVSSDGESFSQTSASIGFLLNGRSLVAHKNKLYAVSSANGVWRGSANGGTWELATASPPFVVDYILKSDGTNLYVYEYATTKDDLWVATDNLPGGTTYTITGDTLPISFTQTSGAASTEYLVLKTTAAAWVLTFGTPGTLNQIVDVDFPATTVPGVVYLDGYFFVMTTAGEIYNSALEDPTSWGALDFISAEIEPDNPVALAKHQNYVVALKDTTTELFYNAANATGSPLARTQNAALQIGCGAGYSVANVDGGLFFISKTRSTGLSVHYFAPDALVPTEVATPPIQRILSAADLTTVHCFAGRITGHTFYVINLVSEGITLAYDLQSRTWAQWTYLTAQAAQNVTSITQADGIATATVTAHGYADGDPVVVAGADQAGYNGTHNIRYVDANTFKFDVDSATVSPATGTITATGYDEGYFPFGFFGSCGGFDYIQHETSGEIFKISRDYFDDNGVPIDMLIRSPRFDSETSVLKAMPNLVVVSDESDNDLLVRHTDDDYDSYTKFRKVNLGTSKPQIRRNGSFRRRAIDFRCTTSNDIRLFAIDIE